jgi:hypothetical protein
VRMPAALLLVQQPPALPPARAGVLSCQNILMSPICREAQRFSGANRVSTTDGSRWTPSEEVSPLNAQAIGGSHAVKPPSYAANRSECGEAATHTPAREEERSSMSDTKS